MRKFTTGVYSLPGYILESGEGRYQHRFGGDSWSIRPDAECNRLPHLIAILDCKDPKLATIQIVDELPLCSYLNCDAWVETQTYEINHQKKQAAMIQSRHPHEPGTDLDLPNPLPEQRLIMRPMEDEELPIDEQSYWRACDSFVGGNSFMRVLGPPVWLDEPISVSCLCGMDTDYVASIGYENMANAGNYSDLVNQAFFFGEGALYFLLCASKRHVTVVSQFT